MTTATIPRLTTAASALHGSVRQLSDRLALTIAAALAVCAMASVLLPGAGTMGFPIKAFAALACIACGLALTVYRPVLFPFLAFVVLIPFDTLLQSGAGTITKFLAIATMGALLLVMIDRRRTVTPPAATLGWLAFIAWSATSLMWAIDPTFGISVLLQVVQLFVMLVIVSMLRIRISEYRWAVAASLAGGVACALFGMYLYFSGHVIHEDKVSQRVSLSISPGTGINADHFAAAFVFPIALALVAFLRCSGWKKAGAALAVAIMTSGVLISATRGSLIALGVVLAYVALVERRRLQVIAIGAAALLLSIPIPGVWQRFGSSEQGDLGGRSGIWTVAGEAFRQHWAVGSGTGNFRLAYSQAYIHVRQNGAMVHRWFEDSHNLIASTSVELGVVGVAIVLAAWFFQFRVVRNIPRDDAFGANRTALEASILGLFVVAMSVDVMWYKYLWLVFIMGALARNAWISELDRQRVAGTHASEPLPT